MSRRPAKAPDEIPWDKIATRLPLIVVLLLLLFGLSWSWYTVDANEQAVVLRFGKFQGEPRGPGLHFCLPFIDQIHKVSIEEKSLRLPFADQDRPARTSEDDTLFLTGDLNAALVEWTIQWRVVEPQLYFKAFYNRADGNYIEKIIQSMSISIMSQLVGNHSFDEVMTTKRTEIAFAAREATQALLDRYECGVAIVDLQLQRVTPPEKVRTSYEQAIASLQRQKTLVNEADREINKILPAAKARADKLIQEARGYAERRQAEAKGDVEALLARCEAYKQAPEITRRRLYLEAMTEILEKVPNKTIIDSDLQQVLPLLQLDNAKGK